MTIKELLQREGISEKAALKEQAILHAHAKISRFQAECSGFENKYGMPFQKMKKKYEGRKESEDFLEEEDYSDWEYAWNSLNWWKKNVKEAQNAD